MSLTREMRGTKTTVKQVIEEAAQFARARGVATVTLAHVLGSQLKLAVGNQRDAWVGIALRDGQMTIEALLDLLGGPVVPDDMIVARAQLSEEAEQALKQAWIRMLGRGEDSVVLVSAVVHACVVAAQGKPGLLPEPNHPVWEALSSWAEDSLSGVGLPRVGDPTGNSDRMLVCGVERLRSAFKDVRISLTARKATVEQGIIKELEGQALVLLDRIVDQIFEHQLR